MRSTQKLRTLLLSSTIAFAGLLVPAGAVGAEQRCDAPPGTSGIDQYCETIPGAKGERESGVGPRVGGSLDRDSSRALRQAGRDGQGVLALPGSGTSNRSDRAAQGDQGGRGQSEKDLGKEPSGNPLAALGSGIESGSTAGKGFVWLLLATGIGMAGIAWIRYRRGTGTT